MPDQGNEFRIQPKDFDREQLPPGDRHLEGEPLVLAIQRYFEREFQSHHGAADIVATADEIIVRWRTRKEPISYVDQAVALLTNGDYARGIELLERALKHDPDNEDALYNLGMALSDQGRLDESISHLQHLLELNDGFARAWVALGVALARTDNLPDAVVALRRSVECDPSDGYARKNLGGLLVETSELDEAEEHLFEAASILPDDQQVWVNLGKLYEKKGDVEAAGKAYLKAIDINPVNKLAELAKEGRSRISQLVFRDGGGETRPDAVLYCLGALQTFEGKPISEIQQIAFEIATLGMGGLDVNNPVEKYSLRSLPGIFSGLHLLCIEYVGFNMLDPKVDIGFDLSKELAEARRMHSSG